MDESFEYYLSLLEQTKNTSSLKSIVEDFEGWRVFPPAEKAQILEAESELGIEFSNDLKSFYLESNGVIYQNSMVIIPITEMITTNLDYRSRQGFSELYMSFDNLLIFGEAPNGDLFAYPIKKSGKIESLDIFGWDHETDSRLWVASDLKNFILRIASEVLVDASN